MKIQLSNKQIEYLIDMLEKVLTVDLTCEQVEIVLIIEILKKLKGGHNVISD